MSYHDRPGGDGRGGYARGYRGEYARGHPRGEYDRGHSRGEYERGKYGGGGREHYYEDTRGGPPRSQQRQERPSRPYDGHRQRDALAGRNWRDRELGGARGGATHLARIHGTEEDKVNCPFYFKIGACRHGDRCSRQHHKPPFSQTMIILHMWSNPASQIAAAGGDPSQLDPKKVQEEFDEFYQEVYDELAKFGEIEELNVCENLGDHMVGNVYAKFADEEDSDAALKGLFGRFYAGRPLVCEFSPVTDFREARCRQYDEAVCTRGGYCNFMHIRTPSRAIKKEIDRKWGKRWKREREKQREAEEEEEEADQEQPPQTSDDPHYNDQPYTSPPLENERKRPRAHEPDQDEAEQYERARARRHREYEHYQPPTDYNEHQPLPPQPRDHTAAPPPPEQNYDQAPHPDDRRGPPDVAGN